jgi:hypothetical protein
VIIHEAVHNTSTFEEFSNNTKGFHRQVYACPNLHAPLRVMRSGETTRLAGDRQRQRVDWEMNGGW